MSATTVPREVDRPEAARTSLRTRQPRLAVHPARGTAYLLIALFLAAFWSAVGYLAWWLLA